MSDSVDKSKKPNVELNVTCPCCNGVLHVKFWKQRETPADPVDYITAVEAEVVKQGTMFPEKKPDIEVTGD